MRIIAALSLFIEIAIIRHVSSQSEPMFVSKEGVHQAMLGQTIDLPCVVAELGDYTVYWSKESNSESGEAIFADRTKMINDDRFEYASKDDDPTNWTIRINHLEGFDQGIYRCMISTVPEQMAQKQILSVKVPASINIVPEKSPYIVDIGTAIQLACYPSGNPLPTIVWTRMGGPLPDGTASHEGRDFVILQASNKHDGTYKCTANNGVGEPAEAEIKIQVVRDDYQKDAPRINASSDLVYVKTNGALNISCLYTASPTPNVKWYHNNYQIEMNSPKNADKLKVTFEEKEDGKQSTTLHIFKMTVDDYGNYKCKADNNLGSAEASIQVTGLPGPAQLDVREHPEGALLSWTIDSPEPILEYKVEYKMIGEKEFQTISIKSENVHDVSSNDLTFKGSHILTSLESEKDYEISMTARNQNGLGPTPADTYHFKTSVLKSKTMDEPAKPPLVKDSESGKNKKTNGSNERLSSFSAIMIIFLSLAIRSMSSS